MCAFKFCFVSAFIKFTHKLIINRVDVISTASVEVIFNIYTNHFLCIFVTSLHQNHRKKDMSTACSRETSVSASIGCSNYNKISHLLLVV